MSTIVVRRTVFLPDTLDDGLSQVSQAFARFKKPPGRSEIMTYCFAQGITALAHSLANKGDILAPVICSPKTKRIMRQLSCSAANSHQLDTLAFDIRDSSENVALSLIQYGFNRLSQDVLTANSFPKLAKLQRTIKAMQVT